MADLLEIDDWVLRVQTPETPGPHPLVLMLHGLTGDEDVMWIFAARLPQNAILVAPRGPYPSPFGGFSWQPKEARAASGNGTAVMDDFSPAMDALMRLLTPENFPTADLNRINLVGFSQGAALAYLIALQHPDRTRLVAGLAGFMPEGAERLANGQPLAGRVVFITHGTQDEMVPYARAQAAKEVFEAAGADVILCSDDVGHKLSAACFRGLQEYFVRNPF